MEIKVNCGCGQNYKFEVEPENGQMPFVVNCPSCGVDGTPAANSFMKQTMAVEEPRMAPQPQQLATTGGTLRINRSAPAEVAVPPPPLVPAGGAAPRPPAIAVKAGKKVKIKGDAHLGLGVLGALLGTGVGAGLMFGFFKLTGFRFPLLGVGIGILTGYGARLVGRGTSNTLAIISAVIAVGSVCGTLYIMFGEVDIINIVSMIVSVSMAYRIVSD